MVISRYVVDGIEIAGLLLGMLGVFYVTSGVFGTRVITIKRALPVALGVGLFGATIALTQEVVHNVAVVAAVGGIGAVVGLYLPKTLGPNMTERQFQFIGLFLTLLGLAAQYVSPLLDLLNVPVK